MYEVFIHTVGRVLSIQICLYTRPAVCTRPMFCSNFVLIYRQRSLFQFVNFPSGGVWGGGLPPPWLS